MKHMRYRSEAGSMSMLTVIFLALILSIITVSMVRLAITEQRQSTDNDLTVRAQYAAESGIEDARRGLAQWQAGTIGLSELEDGTCAPVTGHDPTLSDDIDGGLDSAYTCQFIDINPSAVEFDLDAWETKQLPLSTRGGADFTVVRIDWHFQPKHGTATPNDATTTTASPDGSPTPQLKTQTAWVNASHPAMLRLALFSHPAGGNLGAASFGNPYIAFVNPASNTGTTSLQLGQIPANPLRSARCSNFNQATYSCVINIGQLGDFGRPSVQKSYLRIQALYVPTSVRIQLLNGPNPLDTENMQAVVDVTGRAGDVYRRLEARLGLSDDAFGLPDYAIMSMEDICKDFSITNSPSFFSGQVCSQ